MCVCVCVCCVCVCVCVCVCLCLCVCCFAFYSKFLDDTRKKVLCAEFVDADVLVLLQRYFEKEKKEITQGDVLCEYVDGLCNLYCRG